MADFEGLIRQALSRQDDSDPAIREKVYQSSRRALAKMIAGAGVQPPEIINQQRRALEDAIDRVEAGYRPPEPPAAPVPRVPEAAPPVRDVEPSQQRPEPPAPAARREPALDPDEPYRQAGTAEFDPSLSLGPETGFGIDNGGEFAHDGHEAYETEETEAGMRRRRLIAFGALAAILIFVAWLLYFLVVTLLGSGTPSSGGTPPPASGPSAPRASTTAPANPGEKLITLLSAADTSALETAGRGIAEIVNQSNTEMIRLTSLRSETARNVPAQPILLQLRKGVIPQIAGKRVTVDILAKSGMAGPATFTVGCEFAGEELCGRKRFRVGIQPEPFPFEVDVRPQLSEDDEAYLTISTDVGTGVADESGKGDPIDIVYVRLRIDE